MKLIFLTKRRFPELFYWISAGIILGLMWGIYDLYH